MVLRCLCWGHAQVSYGRPLAQFMAEAFSAAEGTGAAAIMPYKLIPYPYSYIGALYEFGTDSDAYVYAVSTMMQHQANQARPPRLSHATDTAACELRGRRLLRLLAGGAPSAGSPSN